MTQDVAATKGSLGFKERYQDFQYLARQLCILEHYNRRALPDPRVGELRLHSFLTLTLLALERFLRMALGRRATDQDTLPNLLEKATARNNRLFELDDRDSAIKRINDLRRTVMHGGLGITDEAEHLLDSLLPWSVDLFRFTDAVVATFDTETGLPHRRAKVSLASTPLAPSQPRVVLTPLEELVSLNRHNKTYAPGDPQDGLLMFAEGALSMTLVEAAARKWVGADVLPDGARFCNVLAAAVDAGLRIPFDDPEDCIERLASVRNALVHGNFEQAGRQAGERDVAQYFREQYASEIEIMYTICVSFVVQIQERYGEDDGTLFSLEEPNGDIGTQAIVAGRDL